MRWLIFFISLSGIFYPALTFPSHQVVTITITPSYPLNPVSAQLICTSLYTHLPTDALRHLERLSGTTPYSCKFDTSTGKKQLIITYTLKDPSTL